MEKKRVLFVSQEIMPYIEETPIGRIGRYLPQGIQEKGKEIRTFMPRYGTINERRNQLHEVIRLSGMNLIIDNNDHPLIIKVASIQQARMQIYFIDNEDYFQRKANLYDKNGKFFDDNDERAIFFARGVLETVKKLGWSPDIIHCHGWFTSLIPLYVKKSYRDNPLFNETKVVISIYDDDFKEEMHADISKKIKYDGVTKQDLAYYKKTNFVNLIKAAVQYSDGVIIGSRKINKELLEYVGKSGKPVLDYQGEEQYLEAFSDFYDKILIEEPVVSR
ncbi:MAG: glycogen/starch synthase [Bacteroidales bacterium]|nr:glycogen/starch synthase [Bacteroidales bacterium]